MQLVYQSTEYKLLCLPRYRRSQLPVSYENHRGTKHPKKNPHLFLTFIHILIPNYYFFLHFVSSQKKNKKNRILNTVIMNVTLLSLLETHFFKISEFAPIDILRRRCSLISRNTLKFRSSN